jgi:hypothetical protein
MKFSDPGSRLMRELRPEIWADGLDAENQLRFPTLDMAVQGYALFPESVRSV